ncbi:MAG: hypothetical protein VYA86_07180 [Candidatus Thermoplasmatota archaeon]|nr:hypothetical protein [Candidatus Thermoplasmatota archaeon]
MRSASGVYQGTCWTPHQTAEAIRAIVMDDFTQALNNKRIVLASHQTVRTTHAQVIDDIQYRAIKNGTVVGWT